MLCANYDQVWSTQYRPSKATLQCKGHSDRLARQWSLRSLRHKIELALDVDVTENLQEHRYRHRDTPTVTGGKACAVVDGWRIPRTLTTLSWVDGTMSRGYVTLRAGSLSEEDRCQANQDRVYVFLRVFFEASVLLSLYLSKSGSPSLSLKKPWKAFQVCVCVHPCSKGCDLPSKQAGGQRMTSRRWPTKLVMSWDAVRDV